MMRSCRELEELYGHSKCKCAKYREHFPNGECEWHSVSRHSPGLVKDAETLFRWVTPDQVQSGRVVPTSLVGAEGIGVSVIRKAYVTTADLARKREMYARSHNAAIDDVWLASASCLKIRGITLDGRQAFHIYDSASETDQSHADICRSACAPKGTPNRRRAITGILGVLASCFGLVPDQAGE